MRVQASTVAVAEKTPPSEVRLWARGDNPTDYGVHRWTERSDRTVLARFNQRGNRILLDVEHNGAQLASGEPAATAGYAELELRNGEPWLVNIDWSAFGREQIETGQRLYLSSEYDVDPKTGEILALYRVSLVADPATHSARRLASIENTRMVASAAGGDTMDKALLAALKALVAQDDPATVKEGLVSLIGQLDKAPEGGGGAAPAATATEEEPSPAPAAPAAAATEEEPKPAPMAASAAPTQVVRVDASAVERAAATGVKQIEDAQRDHLIATKGDRLEPSIRRWASTQPLAVVRGLIDAAPEPATKPSAPAKPTRGGPVAATAETSEVLEAMGVRASTFRAPYRRDDGAMVFPLNTPTTVRAHGAASGSLKGA